MARRRTEWNVEEQGLVKELKEKGLHIGVILADPWAYPSGLKPSTYRDPLCTIQGIGMEFTRTLCDRLNIPCTYTELNTTEVAQHIGGVLVNGCNVLQLIFFLILTT